MDHIVLLILGVFISFLGIVNIMGNISTIHYIPTTEEGSRKKMYRSMGEPSVQVHLSSVYL